MGKPLLVLLLLTLALASQAASLSSEILAGELERTREAEDMPGLRAAVRYPDGTLVTAAVGYANPETGQPLDDTIGMPGGSTGKTFVAALALLLVEDGVLSLDDPVSRWVGDTDWFPELPNARDLHVRHLLTHTSGMHDWIDSWRFHMRMVGRTIADGSAYFTPEELIGYTLGKRPKFPAGEGYAYTDNSYLVLGRVIEAASGRDYFELLEERILVSQGLDRVRPQLQSALPDIAMGHMGGAPSLKDDGRMKLDPRTEWTGGGLVTDPVMLVTFYAALAEGRVVSAESLATMIDSGFQDPEHTDWYYGMGLFVNEAPRTIGHGGLWPGYRTHVMHFLDSGITVAVQTNRDGRLDLPGLVHRIAKLAEGSPATAYKPSTSLIP
jgi:D-alanyl-D-alanine carboxypeptidase